jgi:hypothetical protein
MIIEWKVNMSFVPWRITLIGTCLSLVSCKTLSEESGYSEDQAAEIASITSEFEVNEFSRCIDSNGDTTGSINVIWRISEGSEDIRSPFITGFSGRLFSLQGTEIDFQALSATKLAEFTVPPIRESHTFPYGSYSAYTLHFPFDKQLTGWTFLRVDGTRIKPSDVTGAQLIIPKYVLGGAYSTRFYFKIEDGGFHEFSCQPVSDNDRAQLNTFNNRTGEKAFKGSRGKKLTLTIPTPAPQKQHPKITAVEKQTQSAAASELLEVLADPDKDTPSTKSSPRLTADLRPVARPKAYDTTYKHVRIYECGENGSVDAIWKIKDKENKVLDATSRFITGFAAELRDEKQRAAFYFSTIEIDSEPAFYSGVMPSNASYYFPTLKFSPESLDLNTAAHSKIPDLKEGERVAAGTIYLPKSGLGQGVSVSLALGQSLRGSPYQAVANCSSVLPRLKIWFKNCLGENSVRMSGRRCEL